MNSEIHYIFGLKIDYKKPLVYNLIRLYGINYCTASAVCKKSGLNPTGFAPLGAKLKAFRDLQTNLAEYSIGILLKKQISESLKKQLHIKSYRGMRHRLGLPIRGQRTHTNATTAKRLISS